MFKQRMRRNLLLRLSTLLLAAILFISVFPGQIIRAAAADSGEVQETAKPVFTVDENGKLTKVEGLEESITKIEIPQTVTSIGKGVFQGLDHVEEIIIPKSVTSIGIYAFVSCKALKCVTIPGSVEAIVPGTFYDCPNLEKVIVLYGTKTVASNAVAECSKFAKLEVAPTVTGIDNAWASALADAGVSLELKIYAEDQGNIPTDKYEPLPEYSPVLFGYEVNDSGNVTINAYYGKKESATEGVPVSVTIPSTINGKDVTDITFPETGEGAFPNDYELKIEANASDKLAEWVIENQNEHDFATVPDKLQSISVKALLGTEEVADVANIMALKTEGNTIQLLPGNTFYYWKGTVTEPTPPISISAIPKIDAENKKGYLFTGWDLTVNGESAKDKYIDDANLPETMLTIPPEDTSITLTAKFTEITNINDSLVRTPINNKSATCIVAYTGKADGTTVEPSLEIADSYKFAGITSPLPVTTIGYVEELDGVTYNGVVFRDRGLKELSIGSGIKSVLPQAFDEAFGLQKIVVRGRDIPNDAISIDSLSVNDYYSKDGVLFRKTADGVELVTYPRGITASTYTVPAEVTSIGAHAFKGCTYITSVSMGTAVKSIGDEAFAGCSNFNTVSLANVETVGANAFENCTSLVSAGMPNVKTINDNAFKGCSNLKTVEWSKVETVGQNAFEGTALTEVVFPGTITSIGDNAFKNCALTKVTVPNMNTTFGADVFPSETKVYGYVGSTAQTAYTDTNQFIPLNTEIGDGEEGGETQTGYQVVVASGSTDWVFISSIEKDGKTTTISEDSAESRQTYAPAGATVTVSVRRLEDGSELLDRVSVSSDFQASTEAALLSIDQIGPSDGNPIEEKSVLVMFSESQKANLKVNEIHMTFTMPATGGNVLISAGTKPAGSSGTPGTPEATPAPSAT